MGNPFKDQFLKKGMVTKKQANKATQERHLVRSKKVKKKLRDEGGVQQRIEQARQEQAARDREQSRLQNEAAKEKEVQGQVRQIIEQNQIKAEGDFVFNFVDNNKIKKLYVGKDVVVGLSKGTMAIVKQGADYCVVSAKAAGQIQERKAECLILLNSPESKELDPDDPYAEFPIPDDW